MEHEHVLRLDDEFELIGSSVANNETTVKGEYELRVAGVNDDGEGGICVIKWTCLGLGYRFTTFILS